MGAIERVFRGRRGGQERPAAAIVAGLWRNGEQGVWYDPSDLSTLFQDAAGTTPVTAPGHPVGLILDKHLGLARGPEKVLNSGFDSGATSWIIVGQDATHIATFANSAVRYQSDTTSPALALTSSTNMTVGATYEIVITLSNWVSGSLKTDSLQPLGTAVGLPFTFTGSGVYRFVGKAIAANFGILRGTTNVDLTIDSISVRELPGNHAVQPTTTSRPTYQVDANGCAYIAFDGVDDFVQTPSSVDFGSTTKIFVGVGMRKLADTGTGLVAELSVGVGASNPGSFAIYASPNAAAQVGAISYITGLGYKYAPVTAPASYVQTVQFDSGLSPAAGQIAQDVNSSTAIALTGGDIGVGNYGSYPMFFGRRGSGGSLFSGRLYRLVVCGSRLSGPQVSAVKKHLNAKARAY